MTDKNFLRQLEGLDLTPFEHRKTQLEVERKTLDEALTRGESRTRDLRKVLADLREQRLSGDKAADALINGESLIEIDGDEEKAKSELNVIEAGRKELMSRRAAVQSAEDALRLEVAIMIASVVDGSIDDLRAQARDHAMALATILASAQALGFCLANLKAIGLAEELKAPTAELARKKLAPHTIRTPEELRHRLETLPVVQLLGRAGCPSLLQI